MTEDWKVGFRRALGDYFWSSSFFAYEDSYYGDGQDYEATIQMRDHLAHCAIDRGSSDSTADFKESHQNFFQDTDADSIVRSFVTALLTCKCGQYHQFPVALEDSLSNAIRAVTR